ncbi:hypothetical protein AB1L30_01560 [Bremerella sp. JC817]|uniref:hypothetical protein n=1 Tax=Bremerella sp. JC817 TaxID=3231756 RepID=UPI003457B58D
MSSVPTYRLTMMAISAFVLLWAVLMPASGAEVECEYPALARVRIVAQHPDRVQVAAKTLPENRLPAASQTADDPQPEQSEEEESTLSVSVTEEPKTEPPKEAAVEPVPANEPATQATPQEKPVVAPAVDAKVSQPLVKETPGRPLTPSDVYAGLELIQRKLDVLSTKMELNRDDLIEIKAREQQVKPMHIYQLHLTCLDQLRTFERQQGVVAVPLIIASPVDYKPGDVYQLTSLLANRLDQFAAEKGYGPLPSDLRPVDGKTPTDVYEMIVPVFCRLLALNKIQKLTPNDVYAQIIRARIDAQAIVSHMAQQHSNSFTEQRHLQARAFGLSGDGNHLQLDNSAIRTPQDAFDACLNARATVNQIWKSQGRTGMPLPKRAAGEKIIPADVFLQTQILIAELNLLKYTTGTTAPTPPTNVFSGKTPAKVYNEACWASYILEALTTEVSAPSQQASRAIRPRS